MPRVVAVSRDAAHRFSKPVVDQIVLVAGIGIEGDAHAGETVQHLSRKRVDPSAPNLRQVHVIHSELFEEVGEHGFTVAPGDMGENITTSGVDLLTLPTGTVLQFGDDASIEITGLRNPCSQINGFEPGLLKAVLGKDENGVVERKGGVMSIVLSSGAVRAGDEITVMLPPEPRTPLQPV
ncbi:MOSC domain-containing protein [Glaciihabitans arcticus]|uniref:MOSC domain-containing protein n=1 Tax=Glaciihabitans arcticus TaxID=2668039 RepID=A0A4Q9GWQ2_9MICO|nr:MOSC domain-containing protein [Glaciihabitans arcticus]TBN57133.1 MOSC domain-containing protein [Glaciihabitans arcticus]